VLGLQKAKLQFNNCTAGMGETQIFGKIAPLKSQFIHHFFSHSVEVSNCSVKIFSIQVKNE